MDIKTGKKYKIYFNPDNINNKTIHILAIVDDDMVVFKYWGKHKHGGYIPLTIWDCLIFTTKKVI